MSIKKIALEDYLAISKDFRGEWTQGVLNFRGDLPMSYLGKRTMLDNENGSTVLLTEGMQFEIIE